MKLNSVIMDWLSAMRLGGRAQGYFRRNTKCSRSVPSSAVSDVLVLTSAAVSTHVVGGWISTSSPLASSPSTLTERWLNKYGKCPFAARSTAAWSSGSLTSNARSPAVQISFTDTCTLTSSSVWVYSTQSEFRKIECARSDGPRRIRKRRTGFHMPAPKRTCPGAQIKARSVPGPCDCTDEKNSFQL